MPKFDVPGEVVQRRFRKFCSVALVTTVRISERTHIIGRSYIQYLTQRNCEKWVKIATNQISTSISAA